MCSSRSISWTQHHTSKLYIQEPGISIYDHLNCTAQILNHLILQVCIITSLNSLLLFCICTSVPAQRLWLRRYVIRVDLRAPRERECLPSFWLGSLALIVVWWVSRNLSSPKRQPHNSVGNSHDHQGQNVHQQCNYDMIPVPKRERVI